MRIIHTADWHIGQTLNGYGRDYEHKEVLKELATLAHKHQADALIIAGDIFDHHNPSGEAQQLFYETLLKLKKARPKMTIVITAGNHDAAGRLSAPHALFDEMGVHIVGNIKRVNGCIAPERHLVKLRNERGELTAQVLAVSYPTSACLPPLKNLQIEEGISPVAEATRALYAQLMEETGALEAGVPLIITGHLHVAGGLESEGAERRILVGGQHAVPPDIFPKEAVYVALGHLHKAQNIGGNEIRYSGSLMPLSMSEISYPHGVTLLSLEGDKVDMKHIKLKRPVDFLAVPATGETRLDELEACFKALDLPKDLPLDRQPFVQVRLAREGIGAGFRAQVDHIAEAFPIRLVETHLTPRAHNALDEASTEPLKRLVELKPEDLFRQAFQRIHDKEPSSKHMEAFHVVAHGAEDV